VSLIIEPNQQLARASDWGLLFANGVLVLGFSNVLLNVGPTMISAPEVSLIFLLETIFGPVWVYLGGYEAPPSSALYGGAVLIATLVVHSVVAMRYDAAAPAASRRSQKPPRAASSKAAGTFAALRDADDGDDDAL
jgi:drug/metabolite transporter (DMT)-like permease